MVWRSMASYLEHVNITTTDVDATIRFLQTAMPEWQVRGEGPGSNNCRRWVHLGTETTYIAIEDRGAQGKGPHEAYLHQGHNHSGFVVQDVKAVRDRMSAAGYRIGQENLNHPHRSRIYFYDHDDMEWEFVQYHSQDPSERNDYSN